MGSATSKSYEDKEEEYLKKLENEAIRAVLPRGLLDEKGNNLKYELHYCLTRNDWWFTIGGSGGLCSQPPAHTMHSLHTALCSAACSPCMVRLVFGVCISRLHACVSRAKSDNTFTQGASCWAGTSAGTTG